MIGILCREDDVNMAYSKLIDILKSLYNKNCSIKIINSTYEYNNPRGSPNDYKMLVKKMVSVKMFY